MRLLRSLFRGNAMDHKKRMSRGGLFITFEGIEGSGKSTQLKKVAAFLIRDGFSVIRTREPGGTRAGERIRRLILSDRSRGLDARAELFLYLASRAQHVSEVLLPSVRSGKILLCDRYSDATLAYQGYGRGLPPRSIRDSIRLAERGLTPDLTLLLDIDPKRGLRRVRRRGAGNRLDREALAFHRRIRTAYLKIARASGGRVRVINADRTPRDVSEDVRKCVMQLIGKRPRRRSPRRG